MPREHLTQERLKELHRIAGPLLNECLVEIALLRDERDAALVGHRIREAQSDLTARSFHASICCACGWECEACDELEFDAMLAQYRAHVLAVAAQQDET